jgi:CheY-like chemotaxis protein
MTGFGMERDVEQARSAGYDAHLVKPVEIDEIGQADPKTRHGHPPVSQRQLISPSEAQQKRLL